MQAGSLKTVLIVDDHPVVRQGLAALLDAEPWIGRTIQTGTVGAAVEAVTLERPDVAVIDLRLPDGDGLDLVTTIGRVHPGCRCVVLTMESSAQRQRHGVRAGAHGYLVKDREPDLIVDAIRLVSRGETVFSLPGDSAPEAAAATTPLGALTPRERQLARLVADGLDNRQISRQTGLADKTVRNMMSTVLVKAGVRDRVNLALLVRSSAPV